MKPTTLAARPGAFIGKDGRLYIRVRKTLPEPGEEYTNRTAVYPSIEAYNQRSSIPDYIDIEEAFPAFSKTVHIDMTTLTITLSN